MNIFYLSKNPKEAAKYHLDKHVVKMILESAQLLSTAHRILDGNITQTTVITKTGKSRNTKRYVLLDQEKDSKLYNATHIHHPCAVWARENINNYMWLYQLFVALCEEYTYRYGKIHKTYTLLHTLLSESPKNISQEPFTQPAQAMPSEYKNSDPVVAYRQYYIGAKSKFAKWTRQQTPDWFICKNIDGENHANI